jgi:hypothetical protein
MIEAWRYSASRARLAIRFVRPIVLELSAGSATPGGKAIQTGPSHRPGQRNRHSVCH